MLKNKYVVIAGISLGVLVLAGGGFAAWHGLRKGSQLNSLQSATAEAGGAGQGFGSSSVPLTPTGPAASSSGGLSVTASNPSGSVGQLDGSQGKAAGAATSGQASSGSGSGAASSAPTIDPSTFGQYDKYQSSTGPLFGDVQAGSGTELTSGHQAAVYYRGWLTNGTLFDQSKTGSNGQLQPFDFTLDAQPEQVIAGWDQGLAGMKVGGIRLLIVPPAVGYGATGQGSIPPNAVLVFEVQLLAVQ
jgi:FKBP-type peptidyl-prolyl cis-trans isomerase FkpA